MDITRNLLTDLLDKALECPVCLEQLDVSAKVLPCQHTFCKRCLDEIVLSRRQLLCPECRVECEVRVEELPPNILLIRLLEGIKNNNRRDRIADTPRMNELLSLVPQTAGQTPRPAMVTGGHSGFGNVQNVLFNKQLNAQPLHQNAAHIPPQPSLVKQAVTPTNLPRAKALYDFRVIDVEEKDCLSFAKGDVITVMRRVDENWAEGKLADKIGIFPISFVEMNGSARALVKLASINTSAPPRCAPPAPVIATPTATTSTAMLTHSPLQSSIISSTDSQSDPLISCSDSSSSTTPCTPSSTSSGNSSSSSSNSILASPVIAVMPVTISGPVIQTTSLVTSSSPSVPSSASPLQAITRSEPLPPLPASVSQVNDANDVNSVSSNSLHNQKRHSFCSVSPQSSVSVTPYQRSQSHVTDPNVSHDQQQQQYRRSMEMLNTPNGTDTSNDGIWWTEFARTAIIRNSGRSDDGCDEPVVTSSISADNSHALVMPAYYVAMYNYKPQKCDELELKKGDMYTVSEKCHDGWYKGVSVCDGSAGVFPGNYVQLAKSSTPHSTPHSAQIQCPVTVQSRLMAKTTPNAEKTQTIAKEPPVPKPKPTSYLKPNLSLQTSSNMSPHSTSQSSQSSQPNTADTNTSPLVYARPRPTGQSFPDVSRNINSLVPPPPPPQRPPRPVSGIVSNSKKADEPSFSHSPQAQLAAAMNQSLLSKQQSASQTSLTHSPPQWHQPKVAATRNTASLIGSSYSASTAITPPNVSVLVSQTSTANNQKPPTDRREKPKEKSSFIKRLTSSKPKRKPQPSPPLNNNNNNVRNSNNNNSFSCDNPSFVDTSTPNLLTLAPIHIRSGSCPNESLVEVSHRKQSSFDDSSNTVIKNSVTKLPLKAPQPIAPALLRERYRCVVPYPPNSDSELELQVGDIVYVHKKREDGWYKGTLQRTGKTGLFPGPFVEMFN